MKTVNVIVMLGILSGAHLILTVGASEEKAEQLIWGNPFKGVAMSVRPRKSRSTLGQKIEISVLIKNAGEDEAVVFTTGGFLDNYRVALFDQEGRPVAKSKLAEEVEEYYGQEGGFHRRRVTRIKPGETREGFQVFTLNEWFEIDKAGTYYLVVMRRLWSWDKGFMISNMAKITIAK